MRQRMWWRGVPARLMLLIAVVAALAMSLLVSPTPRLDAHPGGPASAPSMVAASAPSAEADPAWPEGATARAEPAPVHRSSANVRHSPAGQPRAETARTFGSSTIGGDATTASDRPVFLSRAWTTRSPGAVRPVLDTVAPRLGRAPPSDRVS